MILATITREEFLNEYASSYPDWASNASSAHIATPSDERIAMGWVIEQPLHTYFNWHMNRCDRRIRELEAKVAWLEKCLAEKITETTL